MNKRRRRERITVEQARATRPFKLFFHFAHEEIGVVMLDQAIASKRPERIGHAEIDAEMVRRLHENTDTPGGGVVRSSRTGGGA